MSQLGAIAKRQMRKSLTALCLVVSAFFFLNAHGQATPLRTNFFRLDSLKGLELVNATAEIVDYRGRRALHLTAPKNADKDGGPIVAFVTGSDFKDGTIELDLVGLPITSSDPTARGFVGAVFRAQDHGARYENIYLRPTNGRADDQLRRNHSVQYESLPDFPWHRLRDESPGMYESYVDLEPGAWTKMRIEVAGSKARVYVNGAEQPCLIVNDLKLGDVRGQIGLWALISTDAYFSNLKITQAN